MDSEQGVPLLQKATTGTAKQQIHNYIRTTLCIIGLVVFLVYAFLQSNSSSYSGMASKSYIMCHDQAFAPDARNAEKTSPQVITPIPEPNINSITKNVSPNPYQKLATASKSSSSSSTSSDFIPDIYVITPTYIRKTEKADLTSVLQAAALSGLNIQMIIVEDTTRDTPNSMLLNIQCDYPKMNPNVNITVLTQKTVNKKNGHRGVFQRNAGLEWVVKHQKNTSAIVYFGDDDNTYDQRVYHEFSQIGRDGTLIGLLPVGMAGGVEWEGPICEDGKIKKYHTNYRGDRTFALDMAGFAFTVQALLTSGARMDENWPGGRLETYFATTVTGIPKKAWWDLDEKEKAKVMPLADCCTKVYVWHTKTIQPGRLKKFGAELEVKR